MVSSSKGVAAGRSGPSLVKMGMLLTFLLMDRPEYSTLPVEEEGMLLASEGLLLLRMGVLLTRRLMDKPEYSTLPVERGGDLVFVAVELLTGMEDEVIVTGVAGGAFLMEGGG